jgi:hypothetical protein
MESHVIKYANEDRKNHHLSEMKEDMIMAISDSAARKWIFFLMILLTAVPVQILKAQNAAGSVHLFNNYLYDASVTERSYIEPTFIYMDYENASGYNFSLFGGFPAGENMEVQVWVPYMKVSVGTRSESGLMDPVIGARYRVSMENNTLISAGGTVDIPVGSEDLGQGRGPDLSFYGSLRHYLESGLILCANGGLGFEKRC